MPKCKYCRRTYRVSEWEGSGMRPSQIPSSVCPSCHYGTEGVKEFGRTALELGKKAGKAVLSFLEERKQRQKEPSGKPRIRSTNADGFDDIMELTDIQWIILSDRQLKTVHKRIHDSDDAPPMALVKCCKEFARRYQDVGYVNLVASWYEKGTCVEQDYAQAFEWYNKSAKMFDAEGLFRIGLFYDRGHSVKKNPKRAVEYYLSAAKKGHPIACNNLAVAYHTGDGIEKNFEMAWKWYSQAAELGCINAQKELAEHYSTGEWVDKNDELAFKWWLKAAEKEDVKAQWEVGVCYWDGTGVKKAPEEAFHWWKEAAYNGDKNAMGNIGYLYYHGIGVKKDVGEAKYWLTLAAELGNDKSQEHLKEYDFE